MPPFTPNLDGGMDRLSQRRKVSCVPTSLSALSFPNLKLVTFKTTGWHCSLVRYPNRTLSMPSNCVVVILKHHLIH